MHLAAGLIAAALVLFSAVPAARALTAAPLAFDFAVDPGESASGEIRLFNEQSYAVIVRAEALNFEASEGDEGRGIPNFYPPGEDRGGRALAPWLVLPEPLVIPAGARQSARFQVNVPTGAEPGSRFGAVQLAFTPLDGPGSGVGVSGAIASLILLRVNGESVESLSLTGFRADRKLAESLPIRFQVSVDNAGTVHLRPSGTINIRNLFGRQVASIEVNPEGRSALPGAARRFDAAWEGRRFAFGPYKADLAIQYGQDGALAGQASFSVFPWKPLVAVFGGVFAVVYALWYTLKRIHKR